MATRTEVLQAIGDRYRAARRAERSRILDEFVELTGYHRKHAIRLLAREPRVRVARRGRRPTYGPEVRTALLALWTLSDRLCSKRLKQMIPLLLPAAIRHGVIEDSAGLSSLLLAISPATIDRLLAEARLATSAGRRRRAGMSSAIRRDVPIRTFNDWGDPEPGFVEADFVAHGGTSTAGSFVREPGYDRHRHRLDGMRPGDHPQRPAGDRGDPRRHDAVPRPAQRDRLRQRRQLHE